MVQCSVFFSYVPFGDSFTAGITGFFLKNAVKTRTRTNLIANVNVKSFIIICKLIFNYIDSLIIPETMRSKVNVYPVLFREV